MSSFTKNKNKPSSFSTICTFDCFQELVGLLFSLSIYHTNEKIYIMCDTKTKEEYDKISIKPKLKIGWFQELDKYTHLNRVQMEKQGIWSDFQMSKARVLDRALTIEDDCLFLDSDIIVTDVLDDIDHSKEIGVCPGFIKKTVSDTYGYFNGGMLWAKNKNIPKQWEEYTKTSRYFDQASIEDLYAYYNKTKRAFVFEDNYNLQSWRFVANDEPSTKICSYLSSNVNIGKVFYKNKPLKFVHTHFNRGEFKQVNDFLISLFQQAKMYKVLMSIYRCIHNSWIISIPKQPIAGLGHHNNDSFRELPILMKVNNTDINVQYHDDSIHCRLMPNIILYDRPTLQWITNDIQQSPLLLLGNGNVDEEGKLIKSRFPHLSVKPWIFWPRKPMIVEKLLKEKPVLTYNERIIESIFIGNIENSVQNKYRNTSESWGTVLTEYHCTKGQQHKFSHKEYLMKLRESKFGLCLRGYGSKCHREVELMAFGTVPLVTSEVNTKSYMEPLIEDVHYISVKTPDELKQKVSTMTKEKWETMSYACYEWYQQNVHSKNCWKRTIHFILYE